MNKYPPIVRILGCLLALLVATPTPLVAGPLLLASSLKEWHGEYFGHAEGGLFLNMQLKGFNARTQGISTDVQVYVYDILKKKSSVMSIKPGGDARVLASQIWATGSGKYEITKIVLVDGAGVKRVWAPTTVHRFFVVKRQCLANLGQWVIGPDGATGLSFNFSMVPNSYRENSKKSESSVAAVVDGFTGLIQEQFGGKKVLQGAQDNYSNQHELRRAITFTRQISMFFKLNLFKNNNQAPAIAAVLTTYDANLRKCYTDRLDFNDDLRGEVKFTFLLSPQTGTMAKLKYSGGTANDPKLAECIYYELGHLQFPVPEVMVGELAYTYDVK